jgi:hypothetical protein
MELEQLGNALHALEEAAADVNQTRSDILKRQGWHQTSAYPDSVWRWSKTFPGGVITCQTAHEALRLEVAFQELGDPTVRRP